MSRIPDRAKMGFPFRDYHASAKKVNFIRQPETNRRRINGFVQRHTNHKIRNLAPAGSITSDTRLFIANAMYLKVSRPRDLMHKWEWLKWHHIP